MSSQEIELSGSNEADASSVEPVLPTSNSQDSTIQIMEASKNAEKERLETRRMLNRLTWKRKSLRAKQKLMDLTSSKRDLSIKNKKLLGENKTLKQLIRITRDPNQRRGLLQLMMQNPQMKNPMHHYLRHQGKQLQESMSTGQITLQQQHADVFSTPSVNHISAQMMVPSHVTDAKQLNALMMQHLWAQQHQIHSSNITLGPTNPEMLRQRLMLASNNPFGSVLNQQQHLGASNAALMMQQNALLTQSNGMFGTSLPYAGISAYHTSHFAPGQERGARQLVATRETSRGSVLSAFGSHASVPVVISSNSESIPIKATALK